MRILAVDTASRTCSVAVAEDDVVLAEFTVNHRDTHSRFLMEMIDRVLVISRLLLNDIDGFAVTVGPGSFTGLRIGLSAVKGLAMGLDRPVVGVGSLEALAYPFVHSEKLVCPLLDARRHEVYAALYRSTGVCLEVRRQPFVASLDAALAGIHEPCVFVGDGALVYRDQIMKIVGEKAMIADALYHPIRSSVVAALAMPRFQTGETMGADALVPLYIRPSDAVKMKTV